jgi:large subunit ribosomal protein L5
MASLQLNSQQAYTDVRTELQKENSGVHIFDLSQIEKISINVGVGKFDTKQQADIADYLQKLTGNEPKKVPSKDSIAGFKLRKGVIVGIVSTLRGKKMKDFLTQLIYIALPRTRDFRGCKVDAFDHNNKVYSLGIPNASIFPVVGFDPSVNFGLQINIVFKNSSPLNKELLTKLNFPFKRD